MDDKELIKRISNSFKTGKSRSEITKNMIRRGYRLEYIEALIKKAKRPKKFFIVSIVSVIIIISLLTAVLAIFDEQPTTINEGLGLALNNPLDGFQIIFREKPEKPEFQKKSLNSEQDVQEIYLEDVEITTDFVKYILQEIGALDSLHKNPITRKNPVINFNIEDKKYNAEFKDVLVVSDGLNTDADIQFNSEKETIVNAILNENPSQIFKESIIIGKTTIEKMANEADLFAKGYMTLYNSLK